MEQALKGAAEERHELRAFRAVDAFALEAWRAARPMGRAEGEALAAELRSQLARCGGALLSASAAPAGSATAGRALEEARDALSRCRFAVYLARRLGILDIKAYRALALRGEAARRELHARGP